MEKQMDQNGEQVQLEELKQIKFEERKGVRGEEEGNWK